MYTESDQALKENVDGSAVVLYVNLSSSDVT
jgi:hypothetical protein